jgi:hypothetical protein
MICVISRLCWDTLMIFQTSGVLVSISDSGIF